MITPKQRKNHPACLEEDDVVVLIYRLPTEAVDLEFLRTPQVFHPKGHGAEALVGLQTLLLQEEKTTLPPKSARSSLRVSIVPKIEMMDASE